MDAPIQDQAFQRAAGNFAADRVKAGNGDGFGCIIDDHIHASRLFKGADIAAIAADDAPFHFFIGQRYDRGADFGNVLGGDPLDGIGDDLAGALVAFGAGFSFDLADDARHIVTRFFFCISQNDRTRLFGGQ